MEGYWLVVIKLNKIFNNGNSSEIIERYENAKNKYVNECQEEEGNTYLRVGNSFFRFSVRHRVLAFWKYWALKYMNNNGRFYVGLQAEVAT